MAHAEKLIDLHRGAMLLNVVYGLQYTPHELAGLATEVTRLNEPGVADILRAAATASLTARHHVAV